MNFHEFTIDGEVLILRRIPKSRITNGNGCGKDFVWPTGGPGTVVECSDWNPEPKCGGGLHGWPWGFGLGDGSDYDIIDDIWLVIGCKPEDVVGELEKGAKCKFRRGTIRLEGKFGNAMHRVKDGFVACVEAMAKDAPDSGNAAQIGSSGNAAQIGSSGNAARIGSSGNAARIGSSGNAAQIGSSGYAARITADGKDCCVAIAGNNGRLRVGERGAFALAYWTNTDGWRFLTGKVGENGIEANTWYEVRGGKIEKCK